MTLFKAFSTPTRFFGNLDAEGAATLIAAASDMALVIDDEGAIQDIAFNNEDLARNLEMEGAWIGSSWIDTVTIESRPKVEALMRDAAARATPRWRHLNQVSKTGADVPILYSAVRVSDEGRVVVFGRDLRPMSALQQRLVHAQQSLEQDYSRLRHVEMRYRLLFQMSTEAVLVLDGASAKITEANQAAQRLFGDGGRVLGRALPQLFDPAGAEAVQAMLVALQSAGRADDLHVQLQPDSENATGPGKHVVVSASVFREETTLLYFVRLGTAVVGETVGAPSRSRAALLKLMEEAPDGFVVIATDGRIITANAAFLALAQLPSEEQARGEILDRWLGRQGVDLDVLIANLRHRNTVRLFATVFRGEYGAATEVEVSAVALASGGQQCYGFAIRDVGRRLQEQPAPQPPGSVEHLTELIGRVPLKELVRQSTDVIERLCIEAALRMTSDNRASAAEMLGLSRQSFYMKLHRYGIGDLAAENGA